MALDPLILYSANSELGYRVAELYYGGMHYVWCTPCFEAKTGCEVPPSSAPMKIATRLYEDIVGRDHHSSKIESLRIGIKRGATAKHAAGVITSDQLVDISQIVDKAELRDFMPLLFIIPYNRVTGLLRPAAVGSKANYSSMEYIIESLPKDCFDVIRIHEA
jgi:hypothetical protein